MHISQKWWKKAKIYQKFSDEGDFSRAAAEDMYQHESQGTPLKIPNNGYALGKKWMDATIEMWRWAHKEGLLAPWELWESGEFDEEWVRRVLR